MSAGRRRRARRQHGAGRGRVREMPVGCPQSRGAPSSQRRVVDAIDRARPAVGRWRPVAPGGSVTRGSRVRQFAYSIGYCKTVI